MHELVVYVFFAGIVGHCRETSKTIFVHKRLKRIEGRHCHVGSHVPLEAPKQVRITNILLDDGQLTIVDCTNIIDHLDPPSTTAPCRFHDPHVGNFGFGRFGCGATLQVSILFSDSSKTLDERAIPDIGMDIGMHCVNHVMSLDSLGVQGRSGLRNQSNGMSSWEQLNHW